MIKCIIFDCDGTLVDSEYLSNLGLEIKLKDYGIHASAKELADEYKGVKLSNILSSIEYKYNITLKSDFIPTYREIVGDLFDKHLSPCEGVYDALSDIHLPKCVASNGPLEKIKKVLAITKLSHHFNDDLFSAYEIHSWKPDPDLFLYAASKMGYKPHECAVVEDTMIGITAAKSAGMHPILYDQHHNYNSLSDIHIIHHMKELKKLLSQSVESTL